MANSSPGTHHTNGRRPGQSRWRPILTGVVAIGGVMLTLVAAILLSLQDLPVPTQPPLPTPILIQPSPGTPPPPDTPTPWLVPPTSTPIPTSPPPPVEPTATPPAEATPAPPTSTPVIIAPTPELCTPPAGWIPVAVQSGDTLTSLAYRHNTSASQLMQANCLLDQTLSIGQVIFVPPGVVPPPSPPPCGPPANWVPYTVQSGDTLYSLAERTHTPVNAIVQANCLRSDNIFVGQRLWLPYSPPTLTFTPSITPSATKTATATPGAETPTPSPTTGVDTPTPTLTSEPTDTPSPTQSPTPTPTASPTATQTPPPVPPPTNTPVPFLPTQTSG